MRVSNRLNKHFVAAAAAVAVTGAANAAVVYSGVLNVTIPANIDGLYLNVETGQQGSSGGAVPGWDINPYGSTSLSLYAASGTGYMRHPQATTTAKTNIAAGTAIGSSAFFYGSSSAVIGTLPGQWSLNSTGIIGFKFLAADGLTHYGWARIAIGASLAARTLVDYAFESTAGQSLNAGVVPAPGAIALLGVAGLVTRRRRA
jgi:MYXO-CTERM domain-containing protein